ncbi:hypothetical protein BDZ97DRAFT_1604048, partial [Flammula alnicola]
VQETKRVFFDDRIGEIAGTNKQPWDLMNWVQQRKLPPSEAIQYRNLQYRGEPCNDLPALWDALRSTYNSALDRTYDAVLLESIPQLPVREWAPFSPLELTEALSACSGLSSPGPDHVNW